MSTESSYNVHLSLQDLEDIDPTRPPSDLDTWPTASGKSTHTEEATEARGGGRPNRNQLLGRLNGNIIHAYEHL